MSATSSRPDITLIAATADIVGEGPLWDVAEQALYWVDIVGRALHRRDHATGALSHWSLPERIGSCALRERGGLICALESGFAFFDLTTHRLDWITRPERMISRNRFNDGKCDRAGRFWAGTMDDGAKEHTGSLFRLDADGCAHRMEGAIGISNTVAWSPDDRIFYFGDTMDRVIYAYDHDPGSGEIANRRVFVSTADDPGSPDGSTVDAEGYVWNAQWDGWRLTRYAPDGRVDRVIDLPVQYPTSCMFGGPDLATLFITSARLDLSAEALARQPWAGGLLAIDPGMRGLPETRFAG